MINIEFVGSGGFSCAHTGLKKMQKCVRPSISSILGEWGGERVQSFSPLFQFRLTRVCVDVRTPSVPSSHNYGQSFHNGTSPDSRRVGLDHALSREESRAEKDPKGFECSAAIQTNRNP